MWENGCQKRNSSFKILMTTRVNMIVSKHRNLVLQKPVFLIGNLCYNDNHPNNALLTVMLVEFYVPI